MNVIGKASNTHPTSSNIKTTKTLRSGLVNDSNVLTVHITCVPCGDELFLEVVILPLVEVILRHCEGREKCGVLAAGGDWSHWDCCQPPPATRYSIQDIWSTQHTTLQHYNIQPTLYPNKYKIPFNSPFLTKMFGGFTYYVCNM